MSSQTKALFSFDYQIQLSFDRITIIPCLVSVYREDILPKDTINIGFFGGAGEPDLSDHMSIGVNQKSLDFAKRTGKYIGYYNKHKKPKILPMTGAAPGNPQAFAEACAEEGSWSIGLSPYYDEETHLSNGSLTNAYAAIIYMGQDREANFNDVIGIKRMNVQFALRDGYNILGSHAGLYDGGSIGSLHELVTNLQFGKDVALAQGVEGTSDYFPEFNKKVGKDTGSRIITTNNPRYAVNSLVGLQLKRKEKFGKRQKLFIDDIVELINKEIRKKK